jgi:hypothetical protein
MTDYERGIEAAKKAFYRNMDPGLGVEEAISAYLATTSKPVAEAVKVKPLEWKDKSGEDGYEIKWYGTSPAGMTYVAKAVRRGDMILCNGRYHRFIEDAKFMAQVDYEQRIMSALSTPPQPEAQGDNGGGNAEELVAPIVSLTTGMRELRASLIARTVRQSLRNYGHKSAESTLPECIAVDVERTLAADEKLWNAPPSEKARDCGVDGGPLTEASDCIGSSYTHRTAPEAKP